MELFHDDVLFDNFTGGRVQARRNCEKQDHGLKTTAISVSLRKRFH
jgi:hypothetical protein